MRTQSEMLSDKPDDPEGGVRGPPDEGEGGVEAGNLEYLQSHLTNIACSQRERWRSSKAKMANGCIASQVRISSVADRSAESGATSGEERRHWLSCPRSGQHWGENKKIGVLRTGLGSAQHRQMLLMLNIKYWVL